MKNFKLLLILSVLILFSCSKENTTSSEFQLQYNESNAIDDLISLNEEIIDIAFTNRNDMDAIINNEHSVIHQRAHEIEALIIEINANNPNLNIAKLLSQNVKNQLTHIYSEGDVAEFGTPCTEAFAASAFAAAVVYIVTVVATAGSSTLLSTIGYTVALATAAYNWCNCMDENYDEFEGC